MYCKIIPKVHGKKQWNFLSVTIIDVTNIENQPQVFSRKVKYLCFLTGIESNAAI